MFIVSVMREMGWTYEQYLDQPVHIIELLKAQFSVDAERQESEARKSQAKGKH